MTKNKSLTIDRETALTIPCRYCHAPPGEECVNTLTDKPLTHIAAHWLRLKTAQEGLPF